MDVGSSEVYAAQFDLHYETSELSALNTSGGGFLTQDGNSSYAVRDNLNSSTGTLEYGETRRDTSTGVTSAGTLYALRFEALNVSSNKTTNLSLDDVILSDPDAQEIDNVSVSGLQLNVSPIDDGDQNDSKEDEDGSGGGGFVGGGGDGSAGNATNATNTSGATNSSGAGGNVSANASETPSSGEGDPGVAKNLTGAGEGVSDDSGDGLLGTSLGSEGGLPGLTAFAATAALAMAVLVLRSRSREG